MNKTMRRLTAMALVVSMVTSMVGMIPAAAASNPSYDQIKGSTSDKSNAGNYEYHTVSAGATSGLALDYDVSAQVGNFATDTDSDATVSVEKTIEGTSQENEFEITLTVTTTDDITTLETYPDAAVVLLMDTSISMQYNVAGNDIGWPNNSETARMEMARESANSFLESFISNAGDAERLVSLVTFDREATTVLGWTDAVTADGTVNTSVTNTINNLDTSKFTSSSQLTTSDISNGYTLGDYRGGTNMEAGLMAAEELVEDLLSSRTYADSFTAQENVYVVLLSDGAPTWYMDGNTGSTGSSNSIGTYTTKTETESAATSLKKSAMLYTIAFAEGDAAACYTNSNNTSTITVSNWLGNTISSNISGVQTHFDATTGETLTENFQAIAESIARKASAWIVTDPMGQHIVLGQVTSENETQSGEASYSATNNTIVWNLRSDETYKKVNGVYTYTLTYTITLNTDAATFVAHTYYLTNGVTSLTYCFVDGDALVQESDLKTIYFNVPAVQGEYPTYTYYVRHLIQTGTDENDEKTYDVQKTSSAYTIEKYQWVTNAAANFTYELGKNTDGRTRLVNRIASDMPAAEETMSQFKNDVQILVNGQYLDFYYDLIPTTATVYHNYYDVTNTDNGTTTVLNEEKSTYKYENLVYIDDEYTAATAAGNGYTLVSVESSDGSLTSIKKDFTIDLVEQVKDDDGNETQNIIIFSYEKVDEQRTEATVVVEHVYTDYVWEIGDDGRYELVAEDKSERETITENTVTKYTGDAFTAAQNDKNGVYTFVSASASPSKNFDSATLTVSALSKGETTITLNYEYLPDAIDEDPTDAAVIHQYFAYKTYINEKGELVEDELVLEGTVADEAIADDTWYVGETLHATANAFYNGNDYTQETPDKSGMSLTLEAPIYNEETGALTNNTIVITYIRDDDQLQEVDVTVKHFYTLFTQVVDSETGEVLDDYQVTEGEKEESFPVDGSVLYAGEFFTATASNNYKGKNYSVTATNLLDNGYTLELVKGDNVIEIYYELTEDLGDAELTVTHTYNTYLQTYVDGSVRTTLLDVEYGADDFIQGLNGEKVDFEEKLDFASQYDALYAGYYEDGIPSFERTDSNNLYATLNERFAQQIDLTYTRTLQAYDDTTVTVNHIYTTYTTTVDEAGNVVTETTTDRVDGDTISSTDEAPLYVGMGYTATLENRDGFTAWAQNQPSIILAADENVIDLYYYAYATELVTATVQVVHHYTTSEYVLGDDGQPTTNVLSTSKYAERTVIDLFAGQFFTATLRELDFTFLADDSDLYTDVELVSGNNVINLYYETIIEETFPASLEVTHVYTTHYLVAGSQTWTDPDVDYTGGWSGQTVSYFPDTNEDAFELVDIYSENTSVSEDPYTVVLEEGENAITIYYEREVDDRTVLSVTVKHSYTTYDLYTDASTFDGSTTSNFVVYLEDGSFTADLVEQYLENSYEFEAGEPTIELTTDGALAINLEYLRTMDSTPEVEEEEEEDEPSSGGGSSSSVYYDLVVTYVDEDGNEIATGYTKTYKSGSSYSTTKATISGYTFLQTQGDATSGTIRSDKEVIYVYTLDTVDVPEEDVPLTDIPVTDIDVPVSETPDTPVVDIPEPDVPLTDIPEENPPLTDIPEPDVPLTDIPQTGDSRNLTFLVTVALTSLAGLSLLLKQELDEKKRASK